MTTETLIHARCGGELKPELQPRWALAHSPPKHRFTEGPYISGEEILHRCDRCDHVGVAVDTTRRRRVR